MIGIGIITIMTGMVIIGMVIINATTVNITISGVGIGMNGMDSESGSTFSKSSSLKSGASEAPLPTALLIFMKMLQKTKDHTVRNGSRDLTLGDLVAATYTACGERQAPKILQMAMDSQLIRFKRPVG